MKADQVVCLVYKHEYLISRLLHYKAQLKRLENDCEHIKITQIKFNCCGDEEIIDFGSYKTIDPKLLLHAIEKLIENLKEHIRAIEESLPMIEFEDKIEE